MPVCINVAERQSADLRVDPGHALSSFITIAQEAEGVIWEPAGHEAEAEERILNAGVPGAVIHDDLHQFSISLRTSPTTPKRGSVLGSTQGLLLISAVVAFVVGCVRYGGDQVIRGKGGILDGIKDR